MPAAPPAHDAILRRLLGLHPKTIDLSLDRMWRLLSALDNPQDRLPPVVHVAGTNGKGSTIAALRAMAEAAGLRVHVYTSPHLVRFNERIRLAGTLIDDGALSHLLARVEAANDGAPITFFEITTAAALLAFSETPADLCLLEVGLGGRLDATNVVARPRACAITPVSFDHQAFLGDTITAIAREKAGILRENVPAVIGPQLSEGGKTIRRAIRDMGARPFLFKEDWLTRPTADGRGFIYEDDGISLTLPLPALVGVHQIHNAGLAIALARQKGMVRIPESAALAGMGWLRWPARLQNLTDSPLIRHLPTGAELYLDGGHNPSAAQVLKAFLRGVEPVDRPIILILGMMANKDARAYLAPFKGQVRQVITVPIPDEQGAASPADLAATASDLGFQSAVAAHVQGALERIRNEHGGDVPPFVLVAGSLYLAGHVLKAADRAVV
ncbi:bifunctional folylpolyglutamate synthase/dihydrofolate synthase [Yunchengibacter salinarum]|uniref:bifunctional folylpolyglutamate synthase/dihydrofolate synthase n=1 Tax=Yunchengibacter salinarum TaxID=3133399 RepID=UPI0035B5793E